MAEKKKSSIQLLTFNDEGEIGYAGFCKVQIDTRSNYVNVDPLKEDVKPVCASVKSSFIQHHHLLIIITPNNTQNFIIVFKNILQCNNLVKTLQSKYKDLQVSTLTPNFLISLFRRYNDQDVKKILTSLIHRYSRSQKIDLVKLLKQHNIFDDVYSIFGDQLIVVKTEIIKEKELSTSTQQSRKRKHSSISQLPVELFSSQILVNSSQIKFMMTSRFRRLLIFSSPELSTFHEYKFRGAENNFTCIQCIKKNIAIVEVDKNGEIYAKLIGEKQHLCNPSKIIPENYIEIKIIKQSFYEIFETDNSKILIIFDSEERLKFQEFEWDFDSKKFVCCNCSSKNTELNQKCKAKICNEEAENEYVEIWNDQHDCQKLKYYPEKYFQQLFRPNFEIRDSFVDGNSTKNLIIFDKNDRNLRYYFYFNTSKNCYLCKSCARISAKLEKNEKDEEYVLLSKSNHICELQRYVASVVEEGNPASTFRTDDPYKYLDVFKVDEIPEKLYTNRLKVHELFWLLFAADFVFFFCLYYRQGKKRNQETLYTILIKSVLGRGENFTVFEGQDSDGNLVTIKTESAGGLNLIPAEVLIYQKLQNSGVKHIPKILHSGVTADGKVNYMIMPILGESLEDLKEKIPNMNLYSICRIFQQLLLGIMDIHQAGYLHLNLKPSNIRIGHVGSNDRQNIRIIDFRFSQPIENEQKSVENFVGSPQFASINAHAKQTQSRRDDLYSLWLIIANLFKPLPWTDLVENDEIYKMKLKFLEKSNQKSFLEDIPREMGIILDYINGLKFDDIPDYGYLHHMVNLMFKNCKLPGKPEGVMKHEYPIIFDPENPYLGPNFGSPGRQSMRYRSTGDGGFVIFINDLTAYRDGKKLVPNYDSFRTRNDAFKKFGVKYTIYVKNHSKAEHEKHPEVLYFDVEKPAKKRNRA